MEQFLAQTQQYVENAPLLAFVAAFVGGVLASYTPCVYPMIPILVGVIGAKGTGSRIRGFLLSLIYVFGVAFTYSILGMMAALSGKFFGLVSSHPVSYFIVANICILFGLSMLGVFPMSLPLPSLSSQGKASNRKKDVMEIFLLGATSGLVAAPCTVPVFGTLLTFVALKQNLAFGFSLLFVFSLGMGVLLIGLGTFTSLLSSIPKMGPWPSRIKTGFGIFMLLVGEYFLIQLGQRLV